MHKLWALLKILLINYFGVSTFQIKNKEHHMKYLKTLGLGALIIAALTPTLALYIKLLIDAFDLLAAIGQAGAILTLGFVMVSSIIFVFGIFYVINFFYFADDAQGILALPLSGWQVLGARFSVVLCYEYLTALPFLLPPIFVYGIKAGVPILYWIFALIGFSLVPLLPLGLATIPTVVVMRFANLSGRKDLFKILGGLLVVVLAVAYQFLFQKSGLNVTDPEFLTTLLTDPNGLMNLVSRIFPSTRYLGLSLVHADEWSGFVNLLLFAGMSLLMVALAWVTGEKFYFQGLVGSTETSARRKKPKLEDYERLGRSWPAVVSFWIKEVRLLLRTPTYFINCVLTNFLVPVLVAVPFFIQSNSRDGLVPWEGLFATPQGQTYMMLAIIGLIVFIAGSNGITATSISREGKGFYISKYIPLAYQKQIQAKILSAYVFGALGAVALILIVRILMPLQISLVAMLLGLSLVAILPVIELGMLIDILRPKLVWENEQQAFKQNLNVILLMMGAVLLAGPILYVVFRFIHTPATAAALMLVYFGLIALMMYYFLMDWGVKRYDRLEG